VVWKGSAAFCTTDVTLMEEDGLQGLQICNNFCSGLEQKMKSVNHSVR
jgi:hypothetical protein